MPDPLGYARGALDELRERYGQLSRDELLDLVCSLTKEYVLDQTIPFDFPHPEREAEFRNDAPDAPAGSDDDEAEPSEVRFARLVSGLKARTGLPQFEGFELEDGKVVLIVDNQKVVFGERVTVSLFSRRGPRRPDPTPAPAPRATPRPSAPPPASAPASPPPQPSPRPLSLDDEPAGNDDDDFDDSGVERFGGLDLD